MRLTQGQITSIRETTTAIFGDEAEVWLFGSRVDDKKRGGDIDLYIDSGIHDAAELVQAKLQLLVELRKHLGNRKIDVVVGRSGGQADSAIERIARKTGIRLT